MPTEKNSKYIRGHYRKIGNKKVYVKSYYRNVSNPEKEKAKRKRRSKINDLHQRTRKAKDWSAR